MIPVRKEWWEEAYTRLPTDWPSDMFDLVAHGQSKAMSWLETCTSTAIGYGAACATQIVVFPWFGLHATLKQNLTIGAIFTVVSVVRGYCVRRMFNWWGTL